MTPVGAIVTELLRARLIRLEEELLETIREFERGTGLAVEDLRIERGVDRGEPTGTRAGRQPVINRVRAEVLL